MDIQFDEMSLSKAGLIPNFTLNKLVDSIRRGNCSIIPVDTCYIFIVSALNNKAINNLFKIKKRALNNPVHVCVSSIQQAREIAYIDKKAERLFEYLTPGPITIVMKKKNIIPDILVSDSDFIGVRIPDSPCAIQLCSALGGPITATSANYSGKPALKDYKSVMKYFSDDIDICLSGDDYIRYQNVSTVVKSFEGNVEILRLGEISNTMIERVANNLSYMQIRDFT